MIAVFGRADSWGHAVLNQMLPEETGIKVTGNNHFGRLVDSLGHRVCAQHDARVRSQVQFMKAGRFLIRHVACSTSGRIGSKSVRLPEQRSDILFEMFVVFCAVNNPLFHSGVVGRITGKVKTSTQRHAVIAQTPDQDIPLGVGSRLKNCPLGLFSRTFNHAFASGQIQTAVALCGVFPRVAGCASSTGAKRVRRMHQGVDGLVRDGDIAPHNQFLHSPGIV